ncbi:MAG: hypothetical protein FJW90_01015 [Actinobacteria bacterium]|nr:hypothetical protein [Actinomycetota bacterium]
MLDELKWTITAFMPAGWALILATGRLADICFVVISAGRRSRRPDDWSLRGPIAPLTHQSSWILASLPSRVIAEPPGREQGKSSLVFASIAATGEALEQVGLNPHSGWTGRRGDRRLCP